MMSLDVMSCADALKMISVPGLNHLDWAIVNVSFLVLLHIDSANQVLTKWYYTVIQI